MERYDLVIIGGGVGGLVTAAGAAQFGAKVALIDKESLGGDCLHYGCVPTKRLVHSAKVASLVMKRADEFGVEVENPRLVFKKVMDGMRRVQAEIGRNDDPERFRKMGIRVLFGKGHFIDPHTFMVNGERLYGKKFLIATGSSPVILPIPGLIEAGALTNVTALQLDRLPASMAILGAGPIGMELAQIFGRLGSKVIVIEKMGQILPREDKELSDTLQRIVESEGVEVHTCTEVLKVMVEEGKKVLAVRCATGDTSYSVDEILVAIGRSPNVGGLDLEAAGVRYDPRKGILVDRTMRTNVPHIFACGDVSGPYAFTHVAEYQAGLVVGNALFPFIKRKADYRVVPWVTYTDPELARVGLTEEEARARYGPSRIEVFRFPFGEVDRAVIEGEGQGLIKLVCDRKNRILGAHLLGPHAGELLHEYVLAMKAGLPITAISRSIHVYPTLSQGVKRACDQYYRKKLFSGWFPRVARKLIQWS